MSFTQNKDLAPERHKQKAFGCFFQRQSLKITRYPKAFLSNKLLLKYHSALQGLWDTEASFCYRYEHDVSWRAWYPVRSIEAWLPWRTLLGEKQETLGDMLRCVRSITQQITHTSSPGSPRGPTGPVIPGGPGSPYKNRQEAC